MLQPMEEQNFEESEKLREKAHALIPGGCHTYAKGDDQYPIRAPGFIRKGRGCHVWDVDGNEFIEYGMGLRAVTLGHAFEPVIRMAYRQMLEGSNFLRPSPIEIQCAEELISMVPGTEMVKFAKNGSDTTSAAIKLSRAFTGKDMVAVCEDHPFFSVDDWFIGSTPMSAGVPKAVQAMTVKFRYNDIESVKGLFQKYPKQIACVILEPEKEDPPTRNFLGELQAVCRQNQAVYILDETITGFRWSNGGAQGMYGLVPDLCIFGKALGNGFSIAALAGKREIMELGGLQHDKDRVFLLSLTHGAEAHTMAAAIEVMKTYKRESVVDTMWRQGTALTSVINQAIAEHNLKDYFKVLGRPCCLVYASLDADKKPSQLFRTLFMQETIKRGILAPSFIVSYAHQDADIQRTGEAVHEALRVYRLALEGGVESYLVGRPVKHVWRSRN